MILQKQKKKIDELNIKIFEIEEQNFLEKTELKAEISHALKEKKEVEAIFFSRNVNMK